MEFEEYLKVAEYNFEFIDEDDKKFSTFRKTGKPDNCQTIETHCKALLGYYKQHESENGGEYPHYNKWKKWKEDKGGVDPDNSNANSRNDYMALVYYALWKRPFDAGDPREKGFPYEYGWGTFRSIDLFECINKKPLLMGGDTMNTIRSYEWCKEPKEPFDELEELCRYEHTLGNFCLVPANFNRNRANKGNCWDRWDYSVQYLKDKQFGFKDHLALRAEDKKKSADTYFRGFDKEKDFNRYINTMFLWDYVDKDYNARSLTSWDERRLVDLESKEAGGIPDDKKEIYCIKAARAIKRRGIFMAAMLKLAAMECKVNLEGKEWWDENWKVSPVYQKIMKEVFCTDEIYGGFEDVFEKIKSCLEGFGEGILGIIESADKAMKNIDAK